MVDVREIDGAIAEIENSELTMTLSLIHSDAADE